MFVDARRLDSGLHITSDVCIVGAGAAGITLALELAKHGIDVTLLEGGGMGADPATQQLYAGESIGITHDRPEDSRSRYLGGSTNCWGGWCRPLDDFDFTERAWIPDSGWPISKSDLAPFYARSHHLLQLGPPDYSTQFWRERMDARGAELMDLAGATIQNVLNQLSPPTRFGRAYRDQLETAQNIKVYLFANAAEIQTTHSGTEVSSILVKTLNARTFHAHARYFVLAAGGIENPRLLLCSNAVQTKGIGNQNDLVGRYYMDHPRVQSQRITITDARRYRALYDSSMHRVNAGRRRLNRDIEVHLAPTFETQTELGLPNSRTYLVAHGGNEMSKSYLALKRLQRSLMGRKTFGYPLSRVARDVAILMPTLLAHIPGTMLTVAELRYNGDRNRTNFYLESVLEPVPNPASRVSLSDQKDPLGLPRVKIDWQLTALDKHHAATLPKLIGDGLSTAGIASLSGPPVNGSEWPANVIGCWHHMATTRMSNDPKKGVVDADCKVHGMGNLFVAGSSVFPTAGSDSPTITIVALALRMADHLAMQIGAEIPIQQAV